MTLAEKNPKARLELFFPAGRARIDGEAQHVTELEALFRQRGIPCVRSDFGHGRASLLLGLAADLEQAGEILESYQNAKRS